jgi:hypothetical protein
VNKEKVEQLITSIGKDSFFVGKAEPKRILEIENQLMNVLPNSYKWFLENFGHGGIYGVEILGNGLAEKPSCLSATENWREFGLPGYLVVIEDSGTDYIYCLDTSRIKNEECPVVDWEQGEGIGQIYFETFLDFFEQRLKESLNLL